MKSIKRINNLPKNEYLYAFILGDKTWINDDLNKSFTDNNLLYLLSIGSIQVYFITKILDYLKILFRLKEKYHLIALSLVFSFFFLLLKESIGILRSMSCYILKRILKYFHIKYRYSNVIIVVAIIFLIINPKFIYQAGFLYSFIISYGISLYQKIIKGNYLKKIFKITLLAITFSLPITICLNYKFNLLGIVISFIFSFIFHFLLYPLSIVVFLFPFLGSFYEIIFTIVENISLFLSNIIFLNIIIPKPSLCLVILYYLFLFINPSKNIFYKAIIMIILFKIIYKIFLNDFVLFLDVNQGDAIIFKENNYLSLIDTGSGFKDYSKNIIDYLHSIGFNKINTLIITHGDYDHIGGAIDLVNNFKVEKVIRKKENKILFMHQRIKYK